MVLFLRTSIIIDASTAAAARAAATRRTRACRPWRASEERKSNRIDPNTREVYLEGGDVVRARTFVRATGVTWRRLAIDGFDRLIGDVRLSPVKRVASAVGEGSMAIAFIHKYLQEAAQ